MTRLLSVIDAAKELGFTRAHIYKLMERGAPFVLAKPETAHRGKVARIDIHAFMEWYYGQRRPVGRPTKHKRKKMYQPRIKGKKPCKLYAKHRVK